MRLILLLIPLLSFGQADYAEYHKAINKAETHFFMHGNTDSCFFYYEKAFEYEFIFVKDLVNAAQIAVFTKKPYRKYLVRAFRFGLKPEHLKELKLFEPHYSKLIGDKNLQKVYASQRAKYLEKIDFEYLDWIYGKAVKDQLSKGKKNYQSELILTSTNALRDSMMRRGFPGERIVGISDATIFADAKRAGKDLADRVKNHPALTYMAPDEIQLAQKWPMVMLVHNSCSYQLYANVLLAEMRKGNIHPRDIGLIYDNTFRTSLQQSYCGKSNFKGAYRLNPFAMQRTATADPSLTDKMRDELFIVPLAVDAKKKEFEEKFGFRLFWGFWNCR
jgi:hypothetical protein